MYGTHPLGDPTARRVTRRVALVIAIGVLTSAAPVEAQVPIPPSTQFDVTGFLQEASLDPACASNAHCGGTLRVNGQLVAVPRETIVILPANALTWQELFAQAPAPYGFASGVPSTGLAITDVPAPLTTYEVHVIGNRVTTAPGGDQYIAGLVEVSQQGLNQGAGFINFIDYTTGEMRVGGILGDSTTGTRVRINDPAGRYGRVNTPDQRFTVDADNPTIRSGTGYPMCLPRVAPPAASQPETDPLCPQGNRPLLTAGPPAQYVPSFTMQDPTSANFVPGTMDPRIQAPFEIGDYVTYAGTVVSDNAAAPTAGPWPTGGTASTYVSAHTITNNVAVYTFPGTNPVYVAIEVTIIGTGGLTVIGAGEAAIRTRFEGMSTDPTRNVHLYGIDLDPASGATSDRDWGTIGVDPGPPTGAVRGRWRFRPPCTATVATQKACTPPAAGTFLPPTREVRAVVEGAWAPGQTTTAANGLIYGQYHAPILEYIFPENVPGSPIVPNNFNTIPFLAQGGYTSSAGTLVGQLSPWPDSTVPAPACAIPVVSAGGPYTVASNGTVTLSGSANGTAPITFSWSAPSIGSFVDPTVAAAIYNAPAVATATPVTVQLTATNPCGSGTATATITVNGAQAPTVAHVPAVTVPSGSRVTLTTTASDPQGLPTTISWQQTGGPAVLNPNPATGSSVTFATPVLPLGVVTPVVLSFSITATNTAGVTSAPDLTTVTVVPLVDSVLITAGGTEYRTSKQRLILNATSSVISPNVILTLDPYLTVNGTTFDPSVLGNTFTNNGGGLYVLTLVGAPEPAVPPATPLVVRSNLGGVSPPAGLDRIRQ
jgi:hypothetical protein